MLHTDYIGITLNLKDPNITFDDKICEERKIKGVTAALYFATLSYIPTHFECCGFANQGVSIVKNG